MKLKRTRRWAAGLAVASVVLGGIAGIAYASTASSSGGSGSSPSQTVSSSSPSTSAAASPSKSAGSSPAAKILRRAVHLELVVKTKSGWETVDIDRGTIDSVSSTSITITRPDGPQVSANITPSTKFRGEQQSQIQPGQLARIVQTGGNALTIAAHPQGSAQGQPGAAASSSSAA